MVWLMMFLVTPPFQGISSAMSDDQKIGLRQGGIQASNGGFHSHEATPSHHPNVNEIFHSKPIYLGDPPY